MKLKAIGIIPARLASTRLPEKVLRKIAGRPLIQHVWERARQAKKLSEVIIACDDNRIKQCVRDFGGSAVLTGTQHPNGTSRMAEAAEKHPADVYVNIQGDEPLIDAGLIDKIVETFEKDAKISAVTAAVRRDDREGFLNPNVVKVVCDKEGNALYFSRAPIPCDRDEPQQNFFLKHLGLYGYRRDFLLQFVKWPASILEKKEKLEQLRILEHGSKLRVIETQSDSLGIDTEEDLKALERILQKAGKG